MLEKGRLETLFFVINNNLIFFDLSIFYMIMENILRSYKLTTTLTLDIAHLFQKFLPLHLQQQFVLKLQHY